MFVKKNLLRLLTIPLLAAPLFALAEPSYTATTFPRFFHPTTLGNDGQVIGSYSFNSSVTGVAAIWANGEVTTYGLAGGRFNGISPDGRFVIGDGWNNLSESPYYPLLFQNGTGGPIPLPDGVMAHGSAVNSSGQAVGTLQGSPDASGFMYSNGQMTYLPAGLAPRDINEAGVMAGTANGTDGMSHAMMYRNGETTVLDTGTGAMLSYATAINDNDDVVGLAVLGGEGRPFLYSGGVMHDLGTLGVGTPSEALDINNHGQIVGMSGMHAFLYEDGQMLDLTSLVTGLDGWTLSKAYGINDAGQILVDAYYFNGSGSPGYSYFLLNPVAAVPEPSAWAMLLAGCVLLAWRRARRNGLAAPVVSPGARRRTWWAAPLMLCPLAALADPSYSMTFLPPTFSANILGENGLVIGANDMPDQWHIAAWSNGKVTGYDGLDVLSVTAASRNGMLTGSTFFQGGQVPYIYANGQMTTLASGGIGVDMEGRAINSSGQVAIAATGTTYDWFLFYSNGVTTRIDMFGGNHAIPVDMNEAGAVVGYSETGPNELGAHAFLYANGVATNLGAPGDISYANAINDAGQVVGNFVDEQNLVHAFLYSQGKVTELDSAGYLNFTANDINNAGQIVGSMMDGNSNWHAYLRAQGTMTDLNSLVAGVDGWTIVGARSINSSGEILATACTGFDPGCRDVLLTPLSAVPEPATPALLLGGLCLLAIRSRQRPSGTCQRDLTLHWGARR